MARRCPGSNPTKGLFLKKRSNPDPIKVLNPNRDLSLRPYMGIMSWQEKAGARYYVLSLALLLELIPPPPSLARPPPA